MESFSQQLRQRFLFAGEKDNKGVIRSSLLQALICGRFYWVVSLIFLSTTLAMSDGGGGGMSFSLESPTHVGMNISDLKMLDKFRHGRMLQQAVVDFQLGGQPLPAFIGLYYTKVQLGSPPREFYVQIDPGSDLLWVSCVPCVGCPTSTLLHTLLDFFDPSTSSTSASVSCTDQRCAQIDQSSACSTSNRCGYRLYYQDGTESSGDYVADLMHLDSVQGNATLTDSSAQIVFGCSTSQTQSSGGALDGIFGFGRGGLSVISQLSSQGLAAHVFSHCLQGSVTGGGTLVLGQILEPNIVYTPLVTSRPHYNVNLQSISVNGKRLHIRKSVFSKSHNQGGTIIDSGTTLAYLPQGAYQPLVDKVTRMVSPGARSFDSHGDLCYQITSSLHDTFPSIELHFAGGATMVLRPEDYLYSNGFGVESDPIWCMAFQKMERQDTAIVGALILQDKIVVYDVLNERIGWAPFDCSQPMNLVQAINMTRGGHKGNSAPIQHDLYPSMVFVFFVFLLQL